MIFTDRNELKEALKIEAQNVKEALRKEYAPEVYDELETLIDEHNQKSLEFNKVNGFKFAKTAYVGLTGKEQVFFTLYVENNNMQSMNAYFYICNLSMDIIEATKKAISMVGRTTEIDVMTAANFKKYSFVEPEEIRFGKYKGLNLQEVYEKDRNYVKWLATGFIPRSGASWVTPFMEALETYKAMYWEDVTKENKEKYSFEYYGKDGQRSELELKLMKVEYKGGEQVSYYDYVHKYRLTFELVGNDKYQFFYYANIKDEKYAEITPEEKKEWYDVIGKGVQTYKFYPAKGIYDFMKRYYDVDTNTFKMRATITHKEMVGIKKNKISRPYSLK